MPRKHWFVMFRKWRKQKNIHALKDNDLIMTAETSLPCFLCCHLYTEPPPLPLSDAACQDRERGRKDSKGDDSESQWQKEQRGG